LDLKRLIVFISLIAIGCSASACSSSSPSAPTPWASSTTTPTSVSGATINGTITGSALSALSLSGGGFASLTGPSLMVTVVGTSITASVNPNGTFVLTDVPPGDIQLRFTGPGTDALLTVTGVTGGDELRITVKVDGSTALLQNVSRKDKLNKVESEGTVASGSCASFVVNGTTITTDAATQFSKGTCANVITGAIVQVKGSTQTDATVRATDVKFKTEDDDEDDDADEDTNKIELEGLVTAGGCGSFTVKNVVVTTDATTVFKNGRCAEIAVGVRVHVRATPLGASAALATLVNIQRDADDNGKSGDRDDENDDNRGGSGKGKSTE
jgi:copper chaperone CopZ